MPRRILFLLALLVAAPHAIAKEVGGVQLPEHVTLAPESGTLVLNGAGVRSRFFIKVYVGALYLPARTTDAEAVLRHSGPVAVHMHFLHSEVSKDKLVDAWNDGFRANLPEAEQAKLKERIAQFNALFPTVLKGDVIRLDYLPGKGTSISVNAAPRGVIDGEDFMQAWLRIWLGDKPADGDLKRGMLGGE